MELPVWSRELQLGGTMQGLSIQFNSDAIKIGHQNT